MSELSGLKLRKAACEALYPEKSVVLKHGHVYICDHKPDADGWQSERTAPAIESDPAVSEPMFLEWCAKNELAWKIEVGCHESCCDGTCILVITPQGEPEKILCSIDGATPSEARARAIVAAQEKR